MFELGESKKFLVETMDDIPGGNEGGSKYFLNSFIKLSANRAGQRNESFWILTAYGKTVYFWKQKEIALSSTWNCMKLIRNKN